MRFILIMFITVMSCNALASSPEQVVSQFWQALSHDKNEKADITRLQKLFHSDATVFGVHLKEGKHNLMVKSGTDFIELLNKPSKSGFYECEIVRKVERYDHFSQIYSVVETRFNQEKNTPEFTGVNSIQLVKTKGQWKIISLFYQVENPKHPISVDEGISGRCI
ncbi:hypothetical protein N480_05415 [Pseudoalteromonas luteoviolacea S2607]|uniref:nuclear transport factor 2 family protein n=1 Tax=Pseudoalteromonas luteoviolacea TaxID=43657 RepID=UPI0007B080A3|nr:nuclear transport factor 2 family protein [Pseudoalteromonas luteoviolacea]KZN30391.1 hypothetical protein N480_05415 [Pseudoalteromonas luteoviolacea S2607]